MANRYWVGGTANWDGTAGTKWALTSGGAGGEPVPTSADDVFFDGASGANTVTISSGNTGAKSITCTGFTGTLAGTAAITVSGSITFVAGMTMTYSGNLTLNATATITSAGKTIGRLTVNGSGITVTLGDALLSSDQVIVTRGTFDTANFNVTCAAFSSNNSNTRTLTFGSSTITATTGAGPTVDAWNTSTTTGLTVTSNTCTFSATRSAAKSFNGGGFDFNGMTLNQGGAGALTIVGSNTFSNITNIYSATGATTITFTSGTTTTLSNFTASGAAGKVLTLNTTTTSAATLSKAIGIVNVDYLNISYSTVTGGAIWYAGANSTDSGNNTGWIFSSFSSNNFLAFF